MSPRLLTACSICLVAGLALGAWALCPSRDASEGLWIPDEVDQIGFAVSHIAVQADKGRSSAEAAVLIDQAYRLLAQGQDFATVAQNRGEDRAAVDGGFLGFLEPKDDSTFNGVVRALSPGQISPPVELTDGWRIVKRHSFAEGRALEQKLYIPAHGIFIRWEGMEDGIPGLSREQAKAQAEELLGRLKSGATDLNQAMQQYVEKRFHRTDAFIAMVSNRGQTQDLYWALEKVAPGEFVGPLETVSGWAVLKRGQYFRAAFRHILIQHVLSERRNLSMGRAPEEAKKLANQVLEEARANPGNWDQLVQKYTDDAGTAGKRGSMGVLFPGSIPMGFEKVVYKTKAGEIYPEVVESVYGFHILWRVN